MIEHVVTIDNVNDCGPISSRARASCSCGQVWTARYNGAAAMTAFHMVGDAAGQHQKEAARAA